MGPMASNTSLRHMWQTRPRRIPKDQGGKAVFGGVCTGFGARYGHDPVAVRIAFVITGLIFGGGIFAYLLCWLLIPRIGETASPGRAIMVPKNTLTPAERKDRRTAWWLILGLIIFVPTAHEAGDSRITLGGFVVFLLLWFVAYASHPEPPQSLDDDLVWRNNQTRR